MLVSSILQKEEEESIADLRAVSPTDKRPGFKLEKVGQVNQFEYGSRLISFHASSD